MIKTVTLETAKALKEAGFRQETDFYWSQLHYSRPNELPKIVHESDCRHKEQRDLFSAPSSDEILELLPHTVTKPGYSQLYLLTLWKENANEYHVAYSPLWELSHFEAQTFSGDNPAEILAAMWLYLKKEGLL